MKKLKEYNQQELEDLTDRYNRLVVIHSRKTPMQFYKLIKDFDFYENNDKPVLEISGFDSRTGVRDMIEMEWRK
jgi:DNA-directed RNA polymerase delta subunit